MSEMTSSPARKRKTPRSVWVTGAVLLAVAVGGGWLIAQRLAPPKEAPRAAAAPTGQASPAGPAGGRPGGAPAGATRPNAPRGQPVSAGLVQRRDVREWVRALGTLTAFNTAVVRPKVDGELVAVLFKEGQMVKAGDVLARVDARSFEAQVLQAQGQLAKDSAQLANAQLDLKRYEDLLAKGAIARQQVETQAALVRQLQGTVEAGRAQLGLAQLQRSYTEVRAPIAGRLGLKQADLGALVRSSDPNGLVSITQTHPMAAVFAVPEVQVSELLRKLRAQQPVTVQAWSRDDQEMLATGVVDSTDNAIDTATGTLKVKAALPNRDGRLFPNQFANIRLLLNDLKQSLAVPTAAIQRGAIGTFVYVVGDDQKVTPVKVELLAVEDDWQAVKGALEPGQRVVTDGADRLRKGTLVSVIDPNAAAGRQQP